VRNDHNPRSNERQRLKHPAEARNAFAFSSRWTGNWEHRRRCNDSGHSKAEMCVPPSPVALTYAEICAVENEPLIPADTKFLLTTNSSFIPSSSSSSAPFELELNSHAYERYFDRPEVLESYKAQLTIQTPEFSNLTEDKSVGGRFRPRIHEDVRPSLYS
jgi:hypothetical protein